METNVTFYIEEIEKKKKFGKFKSRYQLSDTDTYTKERA